MVEKKLKEDLTLFISYLITSARGCVDEPQSYGPFRLVDAATRLVMIMKEHGISDELLDTIAHDIDQDKFSTMTDSNRFLKMLDSAVLKILDAVNSVIK